MSDHKKKLVVGQEEVVLLTTFSDPTSALRLAKALVNKKLAACCNLMPAMQSVYYWDNRLNIDNEHQVLIKTKRSLLDKIHRVFDEMHPYELPEFLVLNVDIMSNKYKEWLNRSIEM